MNEIGPLGELIQKYGVTGIFVAILYLLHTMYNRGDLPVEGFAILTSVVLFLLAMMYIVPVAVRSYCHTLDEHHQVIGEVADAINKNTASIETLVETLQISERLEAIVHELRRHGGDINDAWERVSNGEAERG